MKLKTTLVLSAVCLALAACGNKKDKENQDTEAAPATEATAEKTEAMTEDASVIDPAKDDISKPLTTTQLIHSMSVYYGKPVQMIVYPTVYVDQEKCKQDMSGTASAESTEKVVAINFATVPDMAINKGKPYLLKGKIAEIGYWNELKITDAELSPVEGDIKTVTFNPKAISATVVYNVQDIINSIKGWDKKLVTITGDYWGTTTSKSADKTKLLEERVDLQSPGDEKKVGCAFNKEGEASELQPGQKNVSIQGEIDYKMHYGSPYLVNCKLVK